MYCAWFGFHNIIIGFLIIKKYFAPVGMEHLEWDICSYIKRQQQYKSLMSSIYLLFR